MSTLKNFPKSYSFNNPVSITNRNIVKDVVSLLNTRKGTVVNNPNYGIDLDSVLSFTGNLNYVVPLLNISLRSDIEGNVPYCELVKVDAAKDISNKRILNIFLTIRDTETQVVYKPILLRVNVVQ